MAKKLLEIDPPEEEAADAGEARYERGQRRLELTTKSGNIHKEFSHEHGIISVDKEGVEEYRAREEKEQAERTQRLRKVYEKENEKLRTFLESAQSQEPSASVTAAYNGSRLLLTAIVVFFGFRSVVELCALALGRQASDFWSFLALAVMAASVLFANLLPLGALVRHARAIRIGARFLYAAVLIYAGLRGVAHLIDLFLHPPRQGVNWNGVLWRIPVLVLVTAALMAYWRFFLRTRRELVAATEDHANHPFVARHSWAQNRDTLLTALYWLEASLIPVALFTFSVFYFGIDPMMFAYAMTQIPALLFFYLYPAGVYVFFRQVFYPKP